MFKEIKISENIFVEFNSDINEYYMVDGWYSLEQLKEVVSVLDTHTKFSNKDIIRNCYNCLRKIRGHCDDQDNFNKCLGHILCTDIDGCDQYDWILGR